MNIEVEEREQAIVLKITGRITMRNSHELLDSIKANLNKGAPRIYIDLEQVDYMDSSGVGVMITGMKTAKKSDVSLALVAMTRRVQQVMEMSGLSSIFDTYDSLETALAGN